MTPSFKYVFNSFQSLRLLNDIGNDGARFLSYRHQLHTLIIFDNQGAQDPSHLMQLCDHQIEDNPSILT